MTVRKTAVAAAEEQEKAKEAQVLEKRNELAESALTIKSAKECVTEAKEAQKSGDKVLQQASVKKELLENAMKDFVKPLAQGTLPEEEAKEKVHSLVTVLKKFDFDQSMMTALPTSLTKEPEARGAFDLMVVTQLDEEVSKRVASLDTTLREAEPAKAQRAETLSAAESALAAAQEKQKDCAQSFDELRKEQSALKDAASAA